MIEAKTRGSRKQRKEKKNRTKKVRGIAKAKVGQAGKEVRCLALLESSYLACSTYTG